MNTVPRLFRDAAGDILGGGLGLAGPIGIGLGVLQTIGGLIGGIGAKKKVNNLLSQRQAYKTPPEIFQILQATQSNAQQGYDSTTLNYLNNQTDQAFSSSIGAATRLGADPNTLSDIFGQKVNSIMKIGSDNHQLMMDNFSKYLSALGTVAENKAAEQKSQQDILKDKIQAAVANRQQSTANISGGLNTLLASLSSSGISNLYGNGNGNGAGDL